MAQNERISPREHRKQIRAYVKERPRYVLYAKVLDRVLRQACKVSFPEASVQSRPKGVSSFAEKAVRRYDKYKDAVHELTDLCGARVIVQTAEQVLAVRAFIEANFEIVEKEDKAGLLAEGEFGYRDMHYIVAVRPDRAAALGIAPAELKTIGRRRAELQVRTWLQHAWADTLHDRIYKNKLKISTEIKRTGALLAALMEEGDRTFDRLAGDLDGLIANYTAFAGKEEVANEIEVQELILANEPDPARKPALALGIARLYAAMGEHDRVIGLLDPHAGVRGGLRAEILLALGTSLCRKHRAAAGSAEYGRGLRFLEAASELMASGEMDYVPNLRRRESLHARALVRLAHALEALDGRERDALECYYRAHEHEPANPYYLADMLGFEMYVLKAADRPDSMRTTLRGAVKTCRDHVLAGIEMPYACFAAGRLSLLLGECCAAFGYYARGIRHCLAGTYCVPADVMALEVEWLRRVHFGRETPAECRSVMDLLALADGVLSGTRPAEARAKIAAPALIVAGGAGGMDRATLARVRPMLEAALRDFRGTAIAGGTAVGVPGCVGDVAAELDRAGRRHFRLVGYLPEKTPRGVARHAGYDERVTAGVGYSAEQIVRSWSDVLAAGIDPRSVLLLGFGGGDVSAAEYRAALALGASVGVVAGCGGAAEEIVTDPLWSTLPNLLPLPLDPMTARAFVLPGDAELDPEALEAMAGEFHRRYVAGNTRDLPPNLKPWGKLDEGYRLASVAQASHSVRILEAAGFGVRKSARPVVFDSNAFTPAEVEFMAEMEHGRWNMERLGKGWRFGRRDDKRKLHDCLVPWTELPDGDGGVRRYDREAVRAFPEVLAKAGLEVYRPPARASRKKS